MSSLAVVISSLLWNAAMAAAPAGPWAPTAVTEVRVATKGAGASVAAMPWPT
jgi:hypothetical protein